MKNEILIFSNGLNFFMNPPNEYKKIPIKKTLSPEEKPLITFLDQLKESRVNIASKKVKKFFLSNFDKNPFKKNFPNKITRK